MSDEYLFPDGHEGPLVCWSINDGAVYKDGRRVLTLTRVQKVLINNLNGRVRVREVRLLLDDGNVVSFGSYGGSVLGTDGSGYSAFRTAFFAALGQVAPDVEIDTEAALLPKFMFASFIAAISLLIMILAISKGSVVLASLGAVATGVSLWRAWDRRPWDGDRKLICAGDFAAAVSE